MIPFLRMRKISFLKPQQKNKTCVVSKKKVKSVVIKLLIALNFLAVCCLLLSYTAGYISPSRYWIFAFFGLAYPVFIFINLIFIILWLILWKRMVFLSLITVFAAWNQITSLLPLHFSNPKPPKAVSVKIISYNVHSLYGYVKSQSVPETRSKVTEFLTNQQPDIICIQEFFAMGENFNKTVSRFTRAIHLNNYFFKNYREFWDKEKINAIATFSKFPIVRSGSIGFPDKSIFAIFTDLMIDQDTVRVYNLHLEPIRFGDDDYSFYSKLTDAEANTPRIKDGSKKMAWKLKRAFIQRSRQVDMLVGHLNLCPYPLIICGDFNDTPSSYTYHRLTSRWNDAFKKAGREFLGSTYAGKLPSFRIDYILYGDYFSATHYQKFNIDLSDHYPITATLFIKP